MSLWLIMKKDYRNNFLLIFLAILLLVACSATTRYQILSGIFDGVPDPNAKLKEISDSTKIDTSFTKKKLRPTKILTHENKLRHPDRHMGATRDNPLLRENTKKHPRPPPLARWKTPGLLHDQLRLFPYIPTLQ